MTKHIGIVACSAEGASLCYRTIVHEGTQLLGPHAHPEITMHTRSLSEYNERIERGDWEGVGALMLDSARRLRTMGCDVLICPDNTMHRGLAFVIDDSPLPWIHIAQSVAAEAVAKGYTCIGLTGTRWLIDSTVYPEALAAHGLGFKRPPEAERDEFNRIIMDELVNGIFKPEATATFQGSIAKLKADGCDAVVLGCTEIPLIISDENAALPTLDSTRLLARAALRHAVESV